MKEMAVVPDNIITIRQQSTRKQRFSVGDIVMLKSGSPPLTVRMYSAARGSSNAIITVDWFNELENLTATFLPDQLVIFDDEDFDDSDTEEMTTH